MKIVILDTGCANLLSIKWAIQRLGFKPIITLDINVISKASKIFFPGVGTPFVAMKKLKEFGLINFLKRCTQPILGICLGMHLLCLSSEESINTGMLGVIDCSILSLKSSELPLPHTGWNKVIISSKNHFLFKGIPDKSRFYFLHSYALFDNPNSIATTSYGVHFCSVVQKNNFLGVQFHPEKSGFWGAKLLKNFLEI